MNRAACRNPDLWWWYVSCFSSVVFLKGPKFEEICSSHVSHPCAVGRRLWYPINIWLSRFCFFVWVIVSRSTWMRPRPTANKHLYVQHTRVVLRLKGHQAPEFVTMRHIYLSGLAWLLAKFLDTAVPPDFPFCCAKGFLVCCAGSSPIKSMLGEGRGPYARHTKLQLIANSNVGPLKDAHKTKYRTVTKSGICLLLATQYL